MATRTSAHARNDRIAGLQVQVATGDYEIDDRLVVEAIVQGPLEFDPTRDDEVRTLSAIQSAPSPSLDDLAREQLSRYAVDLKRSYRRELKTTKELEERAVATVRALAAAVAERDDDTGNHIQRVHDLGLLLAAQVIPEEVDDPELAYGLILHDVGKIAIPDAILRKPGPLDELEWGLMRTHPEVGARVLESVPFLTRAREVVLHHHERWDGEGYPHNIAGEEIPLWARLFAVVDTVDAMTSNRPYRAGMPLDLALEAVADGAGSQFDPLCAEAFLGIDREVVRELLAPTKSNHIDLLSK
jgi:HD-GYP domain-containing protein (c-di-GMP phosphodiesterase class II)